MKLLLPLLLMSASSFGQVPNYVPTDSLVAWYSFNGNTDDLSGNGNNGINYGATLTTDRNGIANSAYYFDGASRIDLVENFDSIQRTVSVWFNTESVNAVGNSILGNDYPELTNGHTLVNISGNGAVNMAMGLASYTGAPPNLNTWHHVVITRGSDSTRFYFNGSYIASELNDNGASVSANSQFAIIGCSRWWDRYFTGKIDDVGIWSRALTDCEVESLYYAQAPTQATITANGSQLVCDQTGVTYQWLNCDDNYSDISGETNQFYTPSLTGNYAVQTTEGVCVSISECVLVDFTSIQELNPQEKTLLKIVNLLGQEVEQEPNRVLLYIYSDGSIERKLFIK